MPKREILIEALKGIVEKQVEGKDPEADHINADKALIAFIDDVEVTELFEKITKWYV